MSPGCFSGHDVIQHHWCNGFFHIFWARRVWVRQQACLQSCCCNSCFSAFTYGRFSSHWKKKIRERGEKWKKKKWRKRAKARREVFKDKNLLYRTGFIGEADTFLDAEFEALSRKGQFLSKWQRSFPGPRSMAESAARGKSSLAKPGAGGCWSRVQLCCLSRSARPPLTSHGPAAFIYFIAFKRGLEDSFVRILKMKSGVWALSLAISAKRADSKSRVYMKSLSVEEIHIWKNKLGNRALFSPPTLWCLASVIQTDSFKKPVQFISVLLSYYLLLVHLK